MTLLTAEFSEIFTQEFWTIVWENISTWFLSFGKNIILAILVLIIGHNLIKWARKWIVGAMDKTKIEPTVKRFLLSLIKFGLYALLLIGVIGILGIPTSSLIAALSTAGLTLGLALQGSLSNFAGGVLILVFKPFTIGDYIYEDTHQNEGTVIGIDLFYTKLLSVDQKTIVVPNGTLANSSLVNFTKEGKRMLDLSVGISYDSDISKAKEVLLQTLSEEPTLLKDQPMAVYVENLEQSDVRLITHSWVKTEEYWTTRWTLTEKFKLALDKAGIKIPFNQITVSYKKED